MSLLAKIHILPGTCLHRFISTATFFICYPSKCRRATGLTLTRNLSICRPNMWELDDLNRFEGAVNIQRDSYASYIEHYSMLAYFAVAENESIGRERYNFMQAYELI